MNNLDHLRFFFIATSDIHMEYKLRMKPEQLRELAADIEKLVARYHVFDPETEAEPGEIRVSVQFQLLPQLPGDRP